jgi:hypothetical protein
VASHEEFERERLELDTLLKSGLFNRAPNLALLLTYVCTRYFEHQTEQIKEYNIAVEALGRSSEFEPKTDAIVRVEAHRLRKRLKEFYRADGAAHNVQIEIPPGQYAPRFRILETAPAAPVPSAALEAPAAVQASRPKHLLRRWIALAALLLLSVVVPNVRLSGGRTRLSPPESLAVAPGATIRIACGLEDGSYIDQFSNTWSKDSFFQGGTAVHDNSHFIRGTRDQSLYNRRREGNFFYGIPLTPGVYELRLHFAETVYGPDNPGGGGESSRVFSVAINGRQALPWFDVIADTEASTADIRVFKDVSPAADGRLHLQFTPISNMPILSGIEIAPGLKGRMRPIRMVAQGHGYTDKEGRYWEPDRYALGGQLVSRNEPVSGAPDPNLFRGERFGNISYVVPVAEGRYRVTLYFAETWFGPGNAGRGPGLGDRVFDILCNGVAVRRNFDIFKEARGSHRAVTLEIPGVVPNHQGKIVISLPPAHNYACIDAVEVIEEP